ncbi:hypothetical protein MPSEU_000607300 [Mayamaea pseudoterrestris]|nr:hypothetical protein MPSEU_000607300 [Mayamaea pseudoterrestris]
MHRLRSHHGDLVNALCYSIFVPVYGYLGWVQPGPGCLWINLWFNVCAICCWVSYFTGSAFASLLACLTMAISIICMNLYQWPISDEVVVFPQFLWMLLITSGNITLSFRHKLIMGAIALMTTVIVATLSPLVEWTENMPLLLCASAVFTLFHYYAEQHEDKSPSAKTASIVLAGALAYHFSAQLAKMRTTEGYTVEGGYSILQAGFFASVGLAAAGAFQKQIFVTDELEVIVAERTKEIAKQAKELHTVGLAVQASETAVAIATSDQRIEWCNAALERLFPQQNLIGKSLMDLLGSAEVTKTFSHTSTKLTEVFVKDDLYSIDVSPIPQLEVTLNGGSSSLKETEPLLATFTGTRYLVVLKDITAQRAREQAEKHAQKEAMLKQAMMTSMEVLSHELRSPLQGIMGLTSMLLDSESITIEDAKEAMSMVMVSSRLLLTLINNLLDVRKCDAKLMNEFQLSNVPLTESMRDAANFCRPLGAVTNVSVNLSVDPSGEDVLVRMNPIRFQQVVINLVSNAIKYTKPGSNVDMHAEVVVMREVRHLMETALSCGMSAADAAPISDNARVALITVKDAGAGIDTAHLSQIFSKFSQSLAREGVSNVVGNRVAQPTGTGLGLNLCLKFVKRMKGNIFVSENPEGGACFSFYLQCSHQSSDGKDPIRFPGESVSALSPAQSLHRSSATLTLDPNGAIADYRVLIVDDIAINLKVLDRMLSRIGVHNVHCVGSGAKALEVLEVQEFDLVLTDIQMPEMSGIELSEHIHRRNDLSCTPLVIGLVSTALVNQYRVKILFTTSIVFLYFTDGRDQ